MEFNLELVRGVADMWYGFLLASSLFYLSLIKIADPLLGMLYVAQGNVLRGTHGGHCPLRQSV